MTMAIDHQQQRHQLGGLPLDHMPYSAAPQFSNPWAATTAAPSTHMYTTPQTATFPQYTLPKQDASRTMSMPYSSAPAPGHYAPGPLSGHDIQPNSADLRSPYDQAYTSAPPHSASYAPQSATFPPINTFASPQEPSRPSPMAGPPQPTQAFGEALDGARGMVAMSQTDITPRNIYGPRGDRGSTDSYGFPAAAHSAHSSISSASSYPAYFGGSVDSSATDYSSAAESIDSMGSRTLPRPNGLMGANLPPVQSSMMSSFNSKVSSSTQKKHKCKVCDKRFTRPSSLQTHMYSHTGEKPFACEVPGCGRNFSVVSNLRRHRKVHKDSRNGGDDQDGGSPEGSWASSTRD